MNVVAIFAHDHDIGCFCAGTLEKYRQGGHQVYIALTTGDSAPSAEAMGIPARLMGFPAGQLQDGMQERAAVLTAMRWANADIILTNSRYDADADHAVTAKLVADSMLIVSGKLHPADLPPIQKCPHVFYAESFAGLSTQTRYGLAAYVTNTQRFYLTPGVHSNDPYEPDAYVDVSAQMELKLRLLEKYPELSQGCQAQARLRGLQMGKKFAECYTGHRVCGHIADFRLLP